jgi:1,4-dihydroxy-6-naphthoate synthase
MQAKIERAMRSSVEHALANPETAMHYVGEHSQEMDPLGCRQHIALYVNEFTLGYGDEGEDAIRELLDTSSHIGVVPPSDKGLFWDE